jgi:cellulose synthase (UDP-forming)
MHIPRHNNPDEKYSYLLHWQEALTYFSLFSFIGVTYSSFKYFSTAPILYFFYPFFAFSVIYYLISFFIQGFGEHFDFGLHRRILKKWHRKEQIFPTVDVFLPICGEDINIIRNTWLGVAQNKKEYEGEVVVHCLDDGVSAEARALAQEFNFRYLVRDNLGHFKKAGNLHNGFKNSFHELIVIFDADFRPHPDFLNELVPYFLEYPHLGIVQSPQFFDVHESQNWLERGAGAVQEFFYRAIQPSRQIHNGAICVGSNAIYRREALEANGGTTLIEHSEDVHTGFDLRRHGWDLMYIPINLAKGVCPNDLKSFFRQQYRWCRGSMSLMGSKKFWETKLPLNTRLCYATGFFYYIQTAFMSIVVPLIPLSLIFLFPEQAKIQNYIPLIPAFFYTFVVLPYWHRSRYGSETTSVKMVYGWAHFFAVMDSVVQKSMEWHPTGSKQKKSGHYDTFLFLLVVYSLGTSLLWIGRSLWLMSTWSFLNFLPVFLSGLLYFIAVARIIKLGIFDEKYYE